MLSPTLHEELLEHYKYPQNRNRLTSPTHSAESYNPSCGDRITMDIIVENDTAQQIGFVGSGCVISQATASMLTEHCMGKTVSEILTLTKDDILTMIQIELGPTRLKCALISLEVLHKGLKI